MSTTQVCARIALSSSLFLFLVGCAARTASTEVGTTAGVPTPTGTTTCVADGSGWKCESDEVQTTATSSQSQQVATKPTRTTRSRASRPRDNVPWWSIRVRNNRDTQPSTQPEPVEASVQPTLATTQTGQPARVVTSSVGQPTTATPHPAYEAPAQSPQRDPAPVYQAAPVVRTASVNTWSEPVQQSTTSTTTYTITPQQTQQTTQTFVSGDGLGRDFDYAVQLAAFSDYTTSSAFLNDHPTLQLTRIKTISNGRTFYIVIAGTFETKQLAEAQSQMLRSAYGMNEPYIRTVRSIRNATED